MRNLFSWGYVGVGIVAVAMIASGGCGSVVFSGNSGGAGGASSSSSSSSGEAGMGGAGGAGGIGGMLPACDMGKPGTFVVDKVFLGDTNFDGSPNPTNGWKYYGFNIDGRISTKESTDLCVPANGGSKVAVYPDGNDGIDNSFGKNILPILFALASDIGIVNNEAIANGEYSYLMSLDVVDQTECSTPSKFFLGGNLGQPAKFDGTDLWPIDARSVTDPMNPNSAKCAFPDTRLTMGEVRTWPPSQFDINLKISESWMVLPVRVARMTLTMSPDLQGATEVRVGGVMRQEDVAQAFEKAAAAFDKTFCDPSSPTLQSILNQIRLAADIMEDGTQDPNKVCNGISIGIGFTMKSAQLGPVVTTPPPADPCVP